MKSDRTHDSLFDGDIRVCQHRHGYRYSIDSVLLAHFYYCRGDEAILELGAGCGIIDLILCYRFADRIQNITAIEIQPDLAELARVNILANHLEGKVEILTGDIRKADRLIKKNAYSLVYCNPPFYRSGHGRQSLNEEERTARHQLNGDVHCFVQVAAMALHRGGNAMFVYPAENLSELIASLQRVHLEPKEMRFVYNYPGAENSAAQRVLVRAQKNGNVGLAVHPPLYVYAEKNGSYSEEVARMYRRTAQQFT